MPTTTMMVDRLGKIRMFGAPYLGPFGVCSGGVVYAHYQTHHPPRFIGFTLLYPFFVKRANYKPLRTMPVNHQPF